MIALIFIYFKEYAMNNMVKRFSRSEFIKLFHTTDMNPNNIDNQRLSLAYTRFINRIQTVSKLDSCSRLEALQALARTREILFRLQSQHKDSESLSYQLIHSSLSLINFEKQMICLQLKYPGIRNMHEGGRRVILLAEEPHGRQGCDYLH